MINQRNKIIDSKFEGSRLSCVYSDTTHDGDPFASYNNNSSSFYHLQPFYLLFAYELVVATISTFCYGGLQECDVASASASAAWNLIHLLLSKSTRLDV